MTAPVRLQLSRAKGFDLQAMSLGFNGLPAVNVARPGRWGNPFRAGPLCRVMPNVELVATFRKFIERFGGFYAAGDNNLGKPLITTSEIREHLRGRNLACWCKPDAPCHADVLIELANS